MVTDFITNAKSWDVNKLLQTFDERDVLDILAILSSLLPHQDRLI